MLSSQLISEIFLFAYYVLSISQTKVDRLSHSKAKREQKIKNKTKNKYIRLYMKISFR